MIPLFVAIAYWPPAMGIGLPAISDNVIARVGMSEFSDSLLRHLLLTSVFIIAAVTDWLDGYFARKLNVTSAFGRFLDPVADKLMVAVALIILVQWHPNIIMAIAAIVIISREIAVSALREWMAELGKSTSVAVSYVGKVKDNLSNGSDYGAVIKLGVSGDNWLRVDGCSCFPYVMVDDDLFESSLAVSQTKWLGHHIDNQVI